MTNKSTVGPITLRFRARGHLVEWQTSTEHVDLGGVEVPAWITERRIGVGGPDLVVTVAIREGSPDVTQVSFESNAEQSEVRQKHLRALDVDRIAVDLYAAFVAEFGENPTADARDRAMRAAEKVIEQQRLPRDYRILTDDVLRKVAEVYRENIKRGPTKAVAKHFGVKDRMASTYVDRARKAGHLPLTKQGQKKA
ncbi:hypothetical protein [Mycolicibacterium gadium]|uniref:Uncharacterized protein n=1 Tax=Mycolicibacterium gadium TaxID=1794 RepID=A0ABT6GP88_MYCGU|nr:hypothetical protein [Mycolicibacterium gadium]MDG5483341.1 hypothetical protein [Mycolicibacterium gadium]